MINSTAVSPKYIQIANKGGYVAQVDVVYEVNGSVEQQSTPQMSVGMVRKLFMPDGATNLQFEFKMADCGWITIGLEKFPDMGGKNMCFVMWGTIFVAQYAKVECDSPFLIVDNSKAPCWKPPAGKL